ncbi:hypothetical protein VNO77_34440 [Canavalia gladiata]|uniref:Uncharacterized protein n=1 Tax=Canavalia gladiata TaxID=3824 RepID=A0AAN9Q1S8_CANGL
MKCKVSLSVSDARIIKPFSITVMREVANEHSSFNLDSSGLTLNCLGTWRILRNLRCLLLYKANNVTFNRVTGPYEIMAFPAMYNSFLSRSRVMNSTDEWCDAHALLPSAMKRMQASQALGLVHGILTTDNISSINFNGDGVPANNCSCFFARPEPEELDSDPETAHICSSECS